MTSSIMTGLLLVAALSIVGVTADVLLKKAGEGPGLVHLGFFAGGFVLYGLTAFGWFLALKWFKLSTIGVLYPVMTMLLLVASGVFLFREHLTPREVIGVAMAFLSIALLSRFS